MRTYVFMTASVAAASIASAQTVGVVGGQTSVLLDTDTLGSAASLVLSSVSADTIVPGNLGPNSVAFGITPATDFTYDATDFTSGLGGSIEHAGQVLFNADTVVVGDFSIGFDAARAVGDNSGFFVASTTGIAAILFDVEAPSALAFDEFSLTIEANLLVSPEFGTFLLDNQLASTDLTGADVGDAKVEAVTPTPGAFAALALGGLVAARRRR